MMMMMMMGIVNNSVKNEKKIVGPKLRPFRLTGKVWLPICVV